VATHDLLVRIIDVSPDEYDAANDKDTEAIGVAMYDVDGAVVTENYQATEIGGEILRAGGNAFDAAAAVQWALNLAEPENTGLGGGVDAIVHLANGEEWAIDGRETAPAAIDATFYGPPRRNFSRNGYSIGVPGTLATMAYMLNHWGSMNLAQTLQPAIDLGKRGVVVSKQLATSINNRGKFDPDTAAIFYPDGHQFVEGDVYFNPDLVKTFELIAAHGPTVFYDGEIADAIVAAQHKSFDAGMGGVMAHDDLSSFSVDVRKPIGIDYRGYRVNTVGPSTAGGIVLLQMLKMVERFPLGTEPDWGIGSRNATQVMLEAMRLGFRDQDMWMGDVRPGFYTDMPLKQLISDEYLSQRGSPIRPAARIAPTFAGDPRGYGPIEETPAVEEDASKSREGGDTSHFVIVDRWGNIVSATTTLGDGLGSTITVPGYGFVLNDASGRLFNPTPQAGLKKQVLDGGVLRSIVDPGANDAAPSKRALGNIAPTIVEKDGEPVLVTGGAGGAQIPPAVFQVITNVIDFKKPVQEALNAPRIGGDLTTVFWNCVGDPVPPWFAGAQQFPQMTLNALTAIGDTVRRTCEPYPWVGGTESIAIDPDAYSLTAAADPRGLPAVRAPFILAPQ
jgi:gamma-glutamyltranspeptidase/glutathione hydrolase